MLCYSNIARVSLEMVHGIYQGVAIPFLEGFSSGLIGMTLTPNGKMFAGGSDRGWGSRGGKPYNLDRVVWTGKTPFELRDMKAAADGFTLKFTAPVKPETAADPAGYNMTAWTWAYRAEYGGPEVDKVTPEIKSATVAPDGLSVKLVVTPP